MDLEKTLIRMVKFIEVEGEERSKEIARRAEEEAEVALGEKVLAERRKINAYYRRLEDRLEREQIAEVTQLVSEARGALLECKSSSVQEVLGAVHDHILDDIEDRQFYRGLLVKMLAQCLCKCMERFVGVRVRRRDTALVAGALEEAEEVYRRLSGTGVRFEMDTEIYLPESDLGGLVMFAKVGTIKVENTIRSRLELVGEAVHSFIRHQLFAPQSTPLQ